MPLEVSGHFPTSGAVPPEDVVGRHEVIEDIAARLRLGSHLIIAGPRRTGKSSVAGAVAARLEQDGVASLQLEFMFTTTLSAFARAVFEAAARTAAGQGDWWDRMALAVQRAGLAATVRARLGPIAEVGFRLAATSVPERRLEEALSLPGHLADRLDRRVVVVMDEFQDAAKLHADFYRILRRYVAGSDRVSYLFLGSRATLLRNLFVRHNEPLYRAALEYGLPEADPAEWRAYLERKFREVGVAGSPGALEAMLERTGCHPQDTMLLAGEAYAVLCRERRDCLTLEDVAAAGDRVLEALALAFQSEWQEMAGERGARIVLPRIAAGIPVHAGLSRAESKAAAVALSRLVREGVVRRSGRGRYAVREALLAEWLRASATA